MEKFTTGADAKDFVTQNRWMASGDRFVAVRLVSPHVAVLEIYRANLDDLKTYTVLSHVSAGQSSISGIVHRMSGAEGESIFGIVGQVWRDQSDANPTPVQMHKARSLHLMNAER